MQLPFYYTFLPHIQKIGRAVSIKQSRSSILKETFLLICQWNKNFLIGLINSLICPEFSIEYLKIHTIALKMYFTAPKFQLSSKKNCVQCADEKFCLLFA